MKNLDMAAHIARGLIGVSAFCAARAGAWGVWGATGMPGRRLDQVVDDDLSPACRPPSTTQYLAIPFSGFYLGAVQPCPRRPLS